MADSCPRFIGDIDHGGMDLEPAGGGVGGGIAAGDGVKNGCFTGLGKTNDF